MKDIAIAVLNEFHNNGLYVAKESKGGYQLVKEKLDTDKYNQLYNIFNQLDNNGRTNNEKNKNGDSKIRRYEALQNALP